MALAMWAADVRQAFASKTDLCFDLLALSFLHKGPKDRLLCGKGLAKMK